MVGKQLYFEDVEVGIEIPPLVTPPISQATIAKFAGASGDFASVHLDLEFARSVGLPSTNVHGPLKFAYLAQMMTNWIGDNGTLRKLDVMMRAQDRPGDAMTGKGRVTKKYVRDGENYVECEIWLENQRQVTTPGTAIVILPSRSKA